VALGGDAAGGRRAAGGGFCWVGFSPLQFSVPKGEEACQMAALHPRILIMATAPPPTPPDEVGAENKPDRYLRS